MNTQALINSSTRFVPETASMKTSPVIKPASQQERVLTALLYFGSLNAQEAERGPVYARHLNSVISSLTNRYNLEITRQPEKTKGYASFDCYLNRYCLADGELDKAQRIVDLWRVRRGVAPITWRNFPSLILEDYFNPNGFANQNIGGSV